MNEEWEQQVRQLLNGDEKHRAYGLELVDKFLRHLLCWQAIMRFPAISDDELLDCWQETLTNVWVASKKKRVIKENTDGRLQTYVWKIMYARLADHFKREKKQEEVIYRIGNDLRDTLVGGIWDSLDVLERQELEEVIREIIRQLPQKPKLVIQAFVDNYPITYKNLAKKLSAKNGEVVTEKAIERAIAKAREKIREAFSRTSYSSEVGS